MQVSHCLQVAGLDVGWHNPIPLSENPLSHRMEVVRDLLPGQYPFKFVFDGKWSISADYPMVSDGANTNNLLTVIPANASQATQRERIISTGERALTAVSGGRAVSIMTNNSSFRVLGPKPYWV